LAPKWRSNAAAAAAAVSNAAAVYDT